MSSLRSVNSDVLFFDFVQHLLQLSFRLNVMAIIISPILFSIVARNKNQKPHLVSENLTNETKNTLKDLFSSVAQNMWVQGSPSPFPCPVPALYVIHDNSRLLLCFCLFYLLFS